MYANHGWFEGEFNPALLGFDEDIKKYCLKEGGGTFCNVWSQPGSCSSCDAAGFSILNMFGHIPYNTCRNCALPPSILLQCSHARLLLTAPPLGLGSRVANVRDKGPPAGPGRLAPPFCAAAL